MYQGARFYKADLQVQTPADGPRWMDASCRIASKGDGSQDEESARLAAEAVVRRCYEVGLEIVGITDHNFASKHLLPELQEFARSLAPKYGYELVLFPGFEFQAHVGRGCHVLVLLEPATPPDQVDHLMTQCGVPLQRFVGQTPQPSTLPLSDILEVVQKKRADERIHGLVILPHSQAESGIFDDDRIAAWLQQTEFKNPDLLCLEVPKPPSQMSGGWQRLLSNGADCDPAWRRPRKIACLMSSDAKALKADNGSPTYIGGRWSWIKLSEPTIEGLRQAFLDPESRIRLMGERPELAYRYPKIKAIRVTNADFLADMDLTFSPNLNTLIGGGGTGKSTIVEYLRIALGETDGVAGDAAANLSKLRGTIGATTSIEIDIERDEHSWTVKSLAGADPVVVAGEAIPSLSKLFPARVYSQHEIYAIAGDREARSRLLDDLVREDLDRLERRAEELEAEVRALDVEVGQEAALKKQLSDLETNILSLTMKTERLEAVESQLKEWGRLRQEEAVLKTAVDSIEAVARQALTNISTWRVPLDALRSDQNPNHDILATSATEIQTALDSLNSASTAAVEGFKRQALGALATPPVQQLRALHSRASVDSAGRQAELREKGIDPDAYAAYADRLSASAGDRDAVAAKLRVVAERRSARATRLALLKECWAQQTEVRTNKAAALTGAVRKTAAGRPFVEVDVQPYGDAESLQSESRRWIRDKRKLSESDIDEILAAVLKSTPVGVSPTDTLVTWISALRAGESPEGFPWKAAQRETRVFLEWMDESALAGLQLFRVPDRVAIRLYRQDGSLAGELESGLSVGQRCTAILAVLLAQDDAPAIIDQPEDDLDNEFTYRDLVPLIRQSKEERQLIVATHDPNIPVNADAELIVALEARDGRGHLKRMDGRTAVGALDKLVVQHAVEEIMEGSEDAFRRRYEKYGF